MRHDRSPVRRALCACLVVFLWPTADAVLADRLSGSVTDPSGKPVAEARVTLIELNRSVFTAADGGYSFVDVAAGHYHLQAVRAGLGSAVAEVQLDGEMRIDLALNFSEHREKIVVSSNRSGVGTNESVHPVSVLEKDELLADMQPTIGEVVARQAGISSTSFGAGASRPVIRGQQGARVKLLEGGLDTGDASSTSPDHAVGADPFEAERIEILRGPSVLLYGSSATGGAVNIIDERVPEFVPPKKLTGELNLRGGSVAGETAGGLKLRGGAGHLAWQLHGFARDAGDYDIPGAANPDDPASPRETVPNSFVESSGGSGGASWIGRRGYVGVAVKRFSTRYGVPPEDPAERVVIDLEQDRYDLRAGLNYDEGLVRGWRLQAGGTAYEHVELEDGAVGTRFLNDAAEARLELLHGRSGHKGVVGLQVSARDFRALGDEAFVPPSDTEAFALFALQELTRGDARFELGLRVDRQSTRAEGRPDADFDGVSASGGAVLALTEGTSISGSLSHSTRFPVAEELYSDGPHNATLAYEVGDPQLGTEGALGLELGLRHTAGRITGEVNVFATDYSDYIFDAPTGASIDGLPVFRFGQTDAEFYGYEATAVFGLVHDDRQDLDLTLTTDSVRASLADGSPLPFIPPRSHRLSLAYRRGAWSLGAGVEAVESQRRVAQFEAPTGSYALLEASAGYTRVASGKVHQVLLRGRNLADEDARIHASRLKAFAPQPGADFSVTYRLVF